MNTEIKPMIYKWQREAEILAHDTYKGYEFAIISLGTHPCAYVGISKGNRFYKKTQREIDEHIGCHGGFTFSQMGVRNLMQDKWVIGWDYAHCCDYMAILPQSLALGTRKWTTEEILENVHDVIDQIVKEEE